LEPHERRALDLVRAQLKCKQLPACATLGACLPTSDQSFERLTRYEQRPVNDIHRALNQLPKLREDAKKNTHPAPSPYLEDLDDEPATEAEAETVAGSENVPEC